MLGWGGPARQQRSRLLASTLCPDAVLTRLRWAMLHCCCAAAVGVGVATVWASAAPLRSRRHIRPQQGVCCRVEGLALGYGILCWLFGKTGRALQALPKSIASSSQEHCKLPFHCMCQCVPCCQHRACLHPYWHACENTVLASPNHALHPPPNYPHHGLLLAVWDKAAHLWDPHGHRPRSSLAAANLEAWQLQVAMPPAPACEVWCGGHWGRGGGRPGTPERHASRLLR